MAVQTCVQALQADGLRGDTGMKLQTWTQDGRCLLPFLIDVCMAAMLLLSAWLMRFNMACARFPTYCPGGTQPEGFTVDYSTINVEYITIGGTPLKWNCAGQVLAAWMHFAQPFKILFNHLSYF